MPDIYSYHGDTATHHTPDHFHEEYNSTEYLIMCFHTPFTYYSNGKILEGNVGDVLINPPSEYIKHGPSDKTKDGFVNDWIWITGKDAGALIKKAGLPFDEAFPVTDKRLMAPFIKQIGFEHLNKDILYKERIMSVICDMIITIARNRGIAYQNTCEESKFADLRNKMYDEIGEPWTLERMAELTGYSVSRFSFLYKKQFGISPITDLISMRIQKAKNLLLYSDCSITMAAYNTGFSSENHFSYTFKKITGISPQEYRKSKFLK